MKAFATLLITSAAFVFSCQSGSTADKTDLWKQEIFQAEADFAHMALKEGIEPAFLAFAAEDAVMMRNNQVVRGREEIRQWFAKRPSDPSKIKLDWKPDFVEVSASGDLGYTYGPYTLTMIDSAGTAQTQTGIFHTVWKRQPDGSWRFVWD